MRQPEASATRPRDAWFYPAALLVHVVLWALLGEGFLCVWIDAALCAGTVALARRGVLSWQAARLHGAALLFLLADPATASIGTHWLLPALLMPALGTDEKWPLLALKGWWVGVHAATGIYSWLAPASATFFDFGFLPSLLVLLLVSLAIGLQLAVLAPAYAWLARAEVAPRWVLFPVLYAVVEHFVSLPFPLAIPLGFMNVPVFLQAADIAGTSGVTFLVLLAGAAGAEAVWAWRAGDTRKASLLAAVGAGTLALHLGHGAWAMQRHAPREGDPVVRVAMIQPVAPLKILSSEAGVRAEMAGRLLDLSLRAAAATPPPDVIVWPEGAAPFAARTPGFNPEYVASISRLHQSHPVPLLVQDIEFHRPDPAGPMRYHAAMTVIEPVAGPAGSSRKVILMPFTEYLPLEGWLPFLRDWLPGARSVLPGGEAQPLDLPGGPVAPLICYEILFPSHVRALVQEDTGWIANLTNDYWYGVRQPAQHEAFARLRAIENRRPVVRATNAGYSAIIDARGLFIARGGLHTVEVVQGVVPLRPGGRTLHGRFGDWLPRLVLLPLLGIAAIVAEMRRRRRDRTVST